MKILRLSYLFFLGALFFASPVFTEGPSDAIDKTAQKAVVGFVGIIKAPFVWIMEVVAEGMDSILDYFGLNSSPQETKNEEQAKQDQLDEALQKEGGWFWKFVMAFVAGWWVSLTPCIYPLIPVTAGILSSGGTLSIGTQLARSVAYLLGLATVFSTLGYISATTTMIFGQWMYNPWVIGLIVLFFLYFALTTFFLK